MFYGQCNTCGQRWELGKASMCTCEEEHMTKDEALDLALEALESCGAGHITDGGNQWHDEKLFDKSITAIKQARSAPVQDTDAHYKGVVEGVQKLFDDKRAQPAPVQGCEYCAHPLYAGTKCKHCKEKNNG